MGPSWPWSYGSWIHNYLCNQCLSPLMLWVWISIRVRCTTLCDKICQWLATGWWFSPGIPVSSTNKTDCHDIAEILLKVELKPSNKQTTKNLQHMKTRYYVFQVLLKLMSTKTPITDADSIKTLACKVSGLSSVKYKGFGL